MFWRGWQVLETFQALHLEAALVLVEAGTVHPAASAGFGSTAELLGQFEHRQALAGELGGRVVLGAPIGGRLGARVNLRWLTGSEILFTICQSGKARVHVIIIVADHYNVTLTLTEAC